MSTPAPLATAKPGDSIDAIDTPALVIDLDAFERNLATMARFAERARVRLRPHAKTHKCSDIARRQLAVGAVGQCCQKVGEAESLVRGGVRDVLVSNQVVGESKLDRLAVLARDARVALCFDHADQVDAASHAAQRAGVVLGALVEIEVGMQRCGVTPGAAARELAERIANSKGLRFDGIQAYHGKAQHFRSPDQRQTAIDVALRAVAETHAELGRVGLPRGIVTGAGTGTFTIEATSGVYDELQVGSYVFMDADYAANERDPRSPDFEHSLFVLTSVMSTSGGDWCVLDAGLKSFSGESGLPRVVDRPGWSAVGLSDEHTKVALDASARRPVLGEKVLLIPGHCDPTVNLHDHYVCMRQGKVETIWPIDARGASR